MTATEFTYQGADGQTIAAYRWDPDASPKAAVQVAHGASEHAMRYDRVARRLTDAGYVVYAADHRAHGRTGEEHGTLGVARPGGWEAIVDDAHVLTEHIAAEHPGIPIVLFGHSMGSFMAQQYFQRWGGDLVALVLSGTSGGLDLDEATMGMIAALGEGDGENQPSELFAAMFAGFNAPFADGDATGVRVAQPRRRRGAQVRRRPVVRLRPLERIRRRHARRERRRCGQPEAEANGSARDLPIYVMGGELRIPSVARTGLVGARARRPATRRSVRDPSRCQALPRRSPRDAQRRSTARRSRRISSPWIDALIGAGTDSATR